MLSVKKFDNSMGRIDALLNSLCRAQSASTARLSLGLLDGKGLASAARQNLISLNTARTHLRHVFEKTQTNRQAELVRLMLCSPALLQFA